MVISLNVSLPFFILLSTPCHSHFQLYSACYFTSTLLLLHHCSFMSHSTSHLSTLLSSFSPSLSSSLSSSFIHGYHELTLKLQSQVLFFLLLSSSSLVATVSFVLVIPSWCCLLSLHASSSSPSVVLLLPSFSFFFSPISSPSLHSLQFITCLLLSLPSCHLVPSHMLTSSCSSLMPSSQHCYSILLTPCSLALVLVCFLFSLVCSSSVSSSTTPCCLLSS
jgi:hypothetical protein